MLDEAEGVNVSKNPLMAAHTLLGNSTWPRCGPNSALATVHIGGGGGSSPSRGGSGHTVESRFPAPLRDGQPSPECCFSFCC